MSAPFPIPLQGIPAFCRKWRIKELALFGSVLRQDFRTESDVDVLVVFEPDDPWSLLDLASMKLELEAMFGRPVDVVEQAALRNPYRRASILRSKRTVYAA